MHALKRHGQTIASSHLTSEQKQDWTRTNEDQTWHAITQKHYFTSHWYTWRKTNVSNHDEHNRGAAILSHLAAMKKFLSSVLPLASSAVSFLILDSTSRKTREAPQTNAHSTNNQGPRSVFTFTQSVQTLAIRVSNVAR